MNRAFSSISGRSFVVGDGAGICSGHGFDPVTRGPAAQGVNLPLDRPRAGSGGGGIPEPLSLLAAESLPGRTQHGQQDTSHRRPDQGLKADTEGEVPADVADVQRVIGDGEFRRGVDGLETQ